MSTTTNLGRITTIYKGAYSAATTYSKLDVVYYNGSSYVALQTVTGVTPSDDGTYWRMAARGGELATSIADVYDSTATYAVGEYCVYSGSLYRCTTAITTAEVWTAAHWTAVTVASELEANAAKLNDIYTEAESTQLIGSDVGILNGYNSGDTFVTSNNHKVLYIPCDTSTSYVVSRNNTVGNRFYVYLCSGQPAVGSAVVVRKFQVGTVTTPYHEYYTFTTSSSEHYIAVAYYNGNLDTVDEATLRSYIKIEKGTEPTLGISVKEYIPTENVRNTPPAFVSSVDIYVGDELYEETTYAAGTGWTNNGDGSFTHASSDTAAMGLSLPSTVARVGQMFLVEFDTSYSSGEFVRVAIGQGYRILAYNGTTHITLPLKAIEDTVLRFSPSSEIGSTSFTISNISIKRIQPSGTAVTLNVQSVISDNHTKNFGYWNVLLGRNALDAVGTTRTIAIGDFALRDLQGGHRNIAIGTYVMSRLLGGEANIGMGADSMFYTTSSSRAIVVGCWAMYNAASVDSSVAIGTYAMYSSKKSTGDVAIGYQAGININQNDDDDSGYNVAVGYQAGYRNRGGIGCVSVGGYAYGGNGGNYCTNIGYRSSYSNTDNDVTNTTCIGANTAATKSNQVVIGNSSVTEIVLGGKKLVFNSDGTVTWTNP